MRAPAARLGLVLTLSVFLGGLGTVTHLVATRTVALVTASRADALPGEIYWFAFLLMAILALFTTLPVLLIIADRGLQGDALRSQVQESLSVCALSEERFRRLVGEYEGRNSLSAFILPSAANLLLQFLVWDSTLLPQGAAGLLAGLGDGHHEPISVISVLVQAVGELSPLTWALLGAYFYSLQLIIRRWVLSDLTTTVLWKVNARLVASVILGLLLMGVSGGEGGARAEFGPYLAAVGFMIGIVPDLFLRWLTQQIKRLSGIDTLSAGGPLVTAVALQQKIPGIRFWQIDRLREEGIETVQDLALKEVPSLLITIRFPPPLLLYWVDRALLCTQAGADLDLFDAAHLRTATDLVGALARPGGLETVLQGLADGAANRAARAGDKPPNPAAIHLTAPIIEAIASGLGNGPNLRHLLIYRATLDARPTTVPPAPNPAAARPQAGATPAPPDSPATPPTA